MQYNPVHALVERSQSDPHRILGLHRLDEERWVIRVWRPGTLECKIECQGKLIEATMVDPAGLYEWIIEQDVIPSDYLVVDLLGRGNRDPYSFSPTLGELDLHLLHLGLHYESYEVLGARIRMHEGVRGGSFAVWAPNAKSVAVIGDFNDWNPLAHPMRSMGMGGIWEIFIPTIQEGERYQFDLITSSGERRVKTDPFAHLSELRPNYSSIVFDIDKFSWSDCQWMKRREEEGERAPVNIYEMHPGSWQKEGGYFLNYREMGKRLVEYCKAMHYTHVEMMGICEHPLDESWGYQVTGYFAPTSRYGTGEDFQYFVNLLHLNEIGVILDWVPAHFPTDPHSLERYDGTCLYEHQDHRQGYHPHWNTHIFNYGRREVTNFLISSALFWCKKMHIDGLRVDAVASMLYLDYGRREGEWVPNAYGSHINLEAVEFLKHMNSIVHQRCKGVLMIAEESTAFPGITTPLDQGGLGFDLKWSLGWMHDTLSFFERWFDDRKWDLGRILFIAHYAFSEKFLLVLSHDEVVHLKKSLIGKMPGNEWEQFAGIRLLLSFMIGFPGKKLLFMGGEFGQFGEWNNREELPWYLLDRPLNRQLKDCIAALNKMYLDHPALYGDDDSPASFKWARSDFDQTILCSFRFAQGKTLLLLHRFTPVALDRYSLPLEGARGVREIFSTDREEWGGSGRVNSSIENRSGHFEVQVGPLATHVFEVEWN